MFRKYYINIFIYYVITVVSFLAISYYFLVIAEVQNKFLLFFILFLLTIFSAFLISKFSLQPFVEYIANLQNLSKETLHELNLPIATITTNLYMLKKNLTNEKDINRASRIQSACEMLQQRYNELDYMIKLQSSNVVYDEFELGSFVQERVEFLKPIYPHIEFELNLQSTTIKSDKIGFGKVIDNLIDNGVKYSQNIHKISITLQKNSLSITDYGCGMDEVELIKIFDRYYQSNKNMQGFGIGLNMVKRFCDSNHIELNIKSKPNNGTTITLNFKDYEWNKLF